MNDLPKKIGISERSLYGYRAGKYPVTAKALRKLELAEQATGIKPQQGKNVESNAFPKDAEAAEEEINDPYDAVAREEPPLFGVKQQAPMTMEQRMERMETALCRIADALEKLVESKT